MATHDADVPFPSTETASVISRSSNDSPGSRNSLSRFRTPSASITPPPPSSTEQRGLSNDVPRQGSSQDGIASDLQNIRLSEHSGTLDLSELVEAVNTVARGSACHATSLTPEPRSSRDGTPRRRRNGRRPSARLDTLPHDVLHEEHPQDTFHSPGFQQAFQNARQLMLSAHNVLGSSMLHNDPNSTIWRLHQQARELAGIEYPSTRILGFVGDSGVGKSSLLNSLLDTRGLARTSNSGEACTCVVTEYHYHNRDTFNIETSLFTMDDLEEQISHMLQSYRRFHLHSTEMEDTERRDFEASANVARDTFRAMFRGRLSDESFLINEAESDVLETLTRWAADARPSELNTRRTGLSLRDCSNTLMDLSSEPAARNQPAYWPYIQSTKVFLNAHILSRGLVLVDLPGLRDLNSARRIITERYLLHCNEIFAICNIGRAITDEGVHYVFELARRARISHVGIVCTRSDDIRADEAIRDWRGENERILRSLMDAVEADKTDERLAQSELDEYEEDEDLSEDELAHQGELLVRRHMIRNRLRQHDFELKRFLITTRNAIVTTELRDRYNDRLATDDIKVFCVSNADYWEHREQPRRVSRPFLDLSGILQVRRYCISIVANTQRRIATRFMRDQIPAFLAQVDLWVQSGTRTASEERREALCRRLDEVERQLRRDLMSHSSAASRVAQSYREAFVTCIYQSRRISSWSRLAREAGYEWSGWHHATYSSFCRNYGDHETPAVGAHNWNEEAINGMVRDMERPWQNLVLSIQQRQAGLNTLVEGVTDTAIETFETQLDDSYEAAALLLQALVARKQLLLDAIEQANEQFETDTTLIRIDSFSGIRSSLIGRSMERSYRKCMQEKGRGSDGRRKDIINGALASEDLFNNLMRSFRNAFRTKAEDSQQRMCEATTAYLGAVQETFDLVRSENVARESEQDPDFRNRVDEVVTAGRNTMQMIHSVLSA